MQSGTLQFIFAFAVVLILIGAAAWLARRFAGNRLGSNANRGRMPRLAVIDAAAVDGRRRLVLVRRDNIEHLLMIGGPSDIVIEPNIVRVPPTRDQVAARSPVPASPDTSGWTENEPPRAESLDPDFMPILPDLPPPRPPRPAFAGEPRRGPPPAPERRTNDPLADAPPRIDPVQREPSMRDTVARTMPRAEPLVQRAPPRPVEPPFKPVPPPRTVERSTTTAVAADQNLAEMAQRLEAALRRPTNDPRPRSDTAGGIENVGAPPVAPDAPGGRSAPRAPGSDTSAAARTDAPTQTDSEDSSAASSKGPFKNLEDEMANLLGRPKSPK